MRAVAAASAAAGAAQAARRAPITLSGPAVGWDDADTVRYYEAFCRRHARYRRANRELVRHAALEPGQRCLDLAAGTGRTAEVALAALGLDGEVHCVEPAAAMQAAGQARLGGDRRVRWRADWPGEGDFFDRVLCGAAVWQFGPLAERLAEIAGWLRTGGAFVFNIPSLYLGEPDEPGGGEDPLLLALPGRVAARAHRLRPPPAAEFQADAAGIEGGLRAAGFEAVRWQFRVRITQRGLRDWLKIPVLTDFLLPDLPPRQRAAVVDAAFAETDPGSWKWERWSGWTAWKR